MKQLKRALSLCLTGAMVMGTLIAGAAAFTDDAAIAKTQAVDTMVELGVIKGKDDGSFDPAGPVTRAEMAKIVTAMLTGGGEPDAELLEAFPPPTLTDIAGHWAEHYIAYCASLGIIDGRDDGSFDPDGAVTGSECAKMLLLMLGYDPEVYALTGEDWEINTNAFANQRDTDLYRELAEIDLSAPLTREGAAQMACNALDARVMTKTKAGVLSTGEVSYMYVLSEKTFRQEYFAAEE